MQFQRSNPWLFPILILLVVVVLAVAVFVSVAFPGAGYSGMMGNATGWWMAAMVLPLGLVVLLLVLAGIGGPHEVPLASGPSALEILDARYARGEIPRDEYLRVRLDLTERLGGKP